MSKVQTREMLWYLDINHWDFDPQNEGDNPFVYMDEVELSELPEILLDIPNPNNSKLRYFVRFGNGNFSSYNKQDGIWYKEKEVYSNKTIYSVLYEPIFCFEEYKELKNILHSSKRKIGTLAPKVIQDICWWDHQEYLSSIRRETGIRNLKYLSSIRRETGIRNLKL